MPGGVRSPATRRPPRWSSSRRSRAARADLLAPVAGILEGTSERELDEPLARCAAGLCHLAGADPEAIPGWIEEGRRRAASARQSSFSGGPARRRGAPPVRRALDGRPA
jgi:hypothetical protein